MGRAETSFQTWKPRSFLAARNAAPFQNLPDRLHRDRLAPVAQRSKLARYLFERGPVVALAGRVRQADPAVEFANAISPGVVFRFQRRTSFLGERFATVAPLLEQQVLPFEPRDQRRYLGAVAISCDSDSLCGDFFDQIPEDGFLGGVVVFFSWSPSIAVRLGGMIHFPPLHLLEDLAGSHFKPD